LRVPTLWRSHASSRAAQAHAELKGDYAVKQLELERLERLVDTTMSVCAQCARNGALFARR
jgi:hypothetical protein